MRYYAPIRKRNASGELWCKECKEYHPGSEFSPQRGCFAQSCRVSRNRKLLESREKRRQGNLKTKQCEYCGDSFQSFLDRSKYCSPKCKRRGVEKKRWNPWDKTERKCAVCGSTFVPAAASQTSCSVDCRAVIRAKHGRPQRVLRFPGPLIDEVTCETCGTKFTPVHGKSYHYRTAKPKFCNIKCAYEARKGKKSKFYRDGVYGLKIGSSEWRRVSKEIRERDGNICQCCYNTLSKSGKKLPVDHVIPVRKLIEWGISPLQYELLLTVCDSCHGKKVGPESKLFKGDVVSFVRGLYAIGYPRAFTENALRICSLPTLSHL